MSMFEIEVMPRKKTIWQKPIVIFGLWAIPIAITAFYVVSATTDLFDKIDVAVSQVPALEKEVKELKAQLEAKRLAEASPAFAHGAMETEEVEHAVSVPASAPIVNAAPTPIPTSRRTAVMTQRIVHRPPAVYVDVPRDPEPAPAPVQKEIIPEGGNFTLISDEAETVVANSGKFKLIGDK